MPTQRLSQVEFIALIAMLFANIAFSIDAMMPALPAIARDLALADPNTAQLVLTSFVLGMGIGTLFVGPLSDSFGRKPVILVGTALFIMAALAAYFAPTIESMLAARVVQGLGAAAPRIVTLAVVRDLYKGREMARVVSFAMMIFTLVPAVAPLIGSGIIALLGWREIFLSFVIFILIAVIWFILRQPETLPPAARKPMQLRPLIQAFTEVMRNRVVLTSVAVQTLVFACLFGTISSTQQVFDTSFGRGDSFPLWFALIAMLSGSASFLNAAVVVRLGMRLLVTWTLAAVAVVSVVFWGLSISGLLGQQALFAAYVIWNISIFMMAGMTLGNLNAMALEPMGHIAGMAASVTGAISTILGVAIAAQIGLSFDGTPTPLALAVVVLTAAGYILMKSLPKR